MVESSLIKSRNDMASELYSLIIRKVASFFKIYLFFKRLFELSSYGWPVKSNLGGSGSSWLIINLKRVFCTSLALTPELFWGWILFSD